MEEKPSVSVSVRNIVEFVLRRGDINSAALSPRSDLQQGTRIHRRIQKAEQQKGRYRAEVRLSHTEDLGDMTLTVQGIADGIIETDSGVIVDEIKSTAVALEAIDENFNFLHKAQACFYAYFYACDNGLDKVTVRLSYSHIKTNEIKYFTYEMTFDQLRELFDSVRDRYAVWARFTMASEKAARSSAKALKFPFSDYRQGQRELSASVFRAIRDGQTLFAQAPTGLGKTMSTLFASVKAYGEGMGQLIFYLTAKNITRAVAEDAVAKMSAAGLEIHSVTITSKEKICPYGKPCTPEKCPYAGGHYDRINDALYDVLTNVNRVTPDIVREYAEKHSVCPFEFSLDISLFSQIIICDCNYAFDPRARLKRFFDTDKDPDAVLLCDEAHNLPERGREMFSTELEKKKVTDAAKILRTCAPKCSRILKKINEVLITERRRVADAEAEAENTEDFILCTKQQRSSAEEIYKQAYGFTEAFSSFLSEEGHEEEKAATAQLFFDLSAFISIYEQMDENYAVFSSETDDLRLKLFCVNPAPFIGSICSMCRATVFFSATLLPAEYYRKTLSPRPEDCVGVRFLSPFPKENLLLAVCPAVSTRRKDRTGSLPKVVELIDSVTSVKGNYLVFLPSFAYMEKVYHDFSELRKEDTEILVQEPSMDEESRQGFLKKFVEAPEKTLVAFAVTGGVFSEGIDLVGSRLSGTVVVGVGLPKICGQRDLIRDFYSSAEDPVSGYDFAYAYPGFNRVMQAAGRVIRTERDRGFVVLADDRFVSPAYMKMFPPEWAHGRIYRDPGSLKRDIIKFFENQK